MKTFLDPQKNKSSVHMDEFSGVRGLKQIWRRVISSTKDEWIKDEIFERHSEHYINRCFRDWIKH